MTQAYRHESVWPGGGSVEQLSRSRFTLRQARINPTGRLSAAQGITVANLVPAEPDQLDFAGRLFTQWPALREYARGTYPTGLQEPNPTDRIVILEPALWTDRVFDELNQRLIWGIRDGQGDGILLTLPWAGVNEDAIEFLEAVKPDRDKLHRVLVRLVWGPAGLQFEPLSLLSKGTPQGHRVLNPGFDRPLIVSKQSALLDRLRTKYGRDRIATTMTDDEGDDGGGGGVCDKLPPTVRSRLSEAEGLLLQLAESGTRRVNDAAKKRLAELAGKLDRLGLTELGQALAATEGADQVLRSGYLCRLHRQAGTTMME